MKLRILASAKKDLEEGYRFYEAQNEGLGEYFITSAAADIESLRLFAGIHLEECGVNNGFGAGYAASLINSVSATNPHE